MNTRIILLLSVSLLTGCITSRLTWQFIESGTDSILGGVSTGASRKGIEEYLFQCTRSSVGFETV